MKYLTLLSVLLLFSLSAFTQTVENIRVEQDGENLKITYRIGASTEWQLYHVEMTCSMDGATRFEPQAVIGDVGENIIGGKSYYTIIWDVFEDVEEVVNPEFFIRVEKTSDDSPTPAVTRSQESVQQPEETQVKEQVAEQPRDDPPQQPAYEPSFDVEEKSGPDFSRNGFFAYNGTWYYPIGISFGSLNNWGYYVTPMRMGFSELYEAYDFDGYLYNVIDFDYMLAAGVTKHIVSAGPYRLHIYGGLGSHLDFNRIGIEDMYSKSHVMFDTGIINVIGGFNLTVGFAYSFGHNYPFDMVFGLGFVF